MKAQKASDLLVRCLEVRGVKKIFGVPGEENADIMISLLDSPIEFIICRHEQAAAFMADMYGRITGKPGVCLATLGPGASNLITGVANANMDHVPLVALIGQASTRRLHKESHQNMDAISMFKPVSKWAVSILEPQVITEVVEKAFKIAMTSKPGATVIELPEDIASDSIAAEPLRSTEMDYEKGVASYSIKATLDLLSAAKKPLLLVGAGCTRGNCDAELADFIDKTHIYAATTFMAAGCVSARNDYSLLNVGLGLKDIAQQAFDLADTVICIGYDMVEWHPDRWNCSADKTIIHIATSPAEVDKNYLPQVELVGDINSILKKLNQSLNGSQQKDAKLFANIRQSILAELQDHVSDDSFPVKPQRLLSDLREVMADDDILIADVGAHKMWVARQFPAYHSKRCFIFNGFCSMGGAMPGAFTAKQLNPDRHVVALCGDGGFMMSIQALMTAVEYKVPITVIVWQDNGYGLIKWKQQASFGKDAYVDFTNPDLVQVAQALGCHASVVEKTADFKSVVKAAFAIGDRPSVIVVPIDYSENMKLTERLGEIVCH